MSHAIRWGTVVLAFALAASACSVLAPIPDRSRFFTLTAMPVASADPAAAGRSQPVYGLGPIVLPAYLDRNQVATRLSPTEVAYAQWDRWAEPLRNNVSLVLLRNLSAELGTDDIIPYPWVVSSRIDRQIEIQLRRFESDVSGVSHLDARWSIRVPDRERPLVARETTLTRPGKPDDTVASTAALSAMLGELSHEIAGALRALPAVKTRG